MASPAQFARNMERRAVSFDRRRLEIRRIVAYHVLTHVVNATPILSGRARYNWNVGFNTPNYSTDMEGFYVKDGTFPRYAAYLSKMSTSAIALARAQQNDTIYISNAVPYIGLLNRGYSKQAPAQFAQAAALVGASVVKRMRFITD